MPSIHVILTFRHVAACSELLVIVSMSELFDPTCLHLLNQHSKHTCHTNDQLCCCSEFSETGNVSQLFDPASYTFWRNVRERGVAPAAAFGRNPARWDVWQPKTVPPVTSCSAALCCISPGIQSHDLQQCKAAAKSVPPNTSCSGPSVI